MPSTDPGDRIYVIGDIHGRYDLLRRLLDRIGEHSAALPAPRALHIVCLGDLVDRGPDSARVVEFLHGLQQETDQLVVLMGNHEEAFVRSVEGDTRTMEKWLAVGGAETLSSYGARLPAPGDDLRRYARYLQSALPQRQMRWLRDLPLFAESGDYFFCHAGVRPGIALARQTRSDLLWIRDDFIDDERDHGAVIVHGHTITREVTFRANRIGLDTGAYRSGVLSALYLEDDRREVVSAQDVAVHAGAFR